MINHHIQAAAIRNAILNGKNILVIAHKRPDGDTIGAATAWSHILTKHKKQFTVFCLDPVPEYLRHLPGSHQLITDPSVFNADHDVIIVNDSGDLEYAGIDTYVTVTPGGPIVINVDHHATNPNFGHFNIVIDNASSTTEVLYRLFTHWQEPITKELAECLLTGIITDTNNLSNPATSYRSLAIASELVKAGANIHNTITRFLRQKSIIDLRLWGLVLSRLKRNEDYGVIATYLTQKDLTDLGADSHSADGISNYLCLIPDAKIIMVLSEIAPGLIKGSLRSTTADIDVGALALALGGGGHKKASGFKLRGSIVSDGDRWTVV